MAAISPDGKYVVHVVADNAGQSLLIRHIPTNSVTPIVPPSDVRYGGLTFSPDGNYIYYTRYEKDHPDVGLLYQIPVLGGAARLIVTDMDGGISFSHDGRRFAFRRESAKSSAIMVADSDGSHEQKVAEEMVPAVFGNNPSWSPDGKIIAVMEFFGAKTGEFGQFVTLDVATGRKTPLATVSRAGQVFDSSWLPDGSGLLVAVNGPNTNWITQLGVLSYPGGEFRRITNDLNGYAQEISTTSDGSSLVAVAIEQSDNIWIMPANGTAAQAVQISSGKAEAGWVDWTDDGRILSVTVGSRGFEFDLRNSDGSGKTPILADTKPSFQPSACGAGHHIVFTSLRTQDQIAIWRIDTNGGDLKQITTGPANQSPICSPDGQWVVYQGLNDSGFSTWKVPIDGGSPVSLSSRAIALEPEVSPDGTMVAFKSISGTGANQRSLWIVVPSSGGAPLYTLNADPRPSRRMRFTPDGKSLSYAVNEHGIGNLWAMPLAGGEPKQLTDFKSDQIFDYAWSRDGKHLALSRGQVSQDVVMLTDTTK